MAAAALLALLALAACGPLVQIGGNAPAPASLLTLTAEPATTPAPGPVDRALNRGMGLFGAVRA